MQSNRKPAGVLSEAERLQLLEVVRAARRLVEDALAQLIEPTREEA